MPNPATRPVAGAQPPALARPQPLKALRRHRKAWSRRLRRRARQAVRKARGAVSRTARTAARETGRALQGESRRAWRDFRQSLGTAHTTNPAGASKRSNAKSGARKAPAAKPRPVPGAGKPCQRCHNTGLIPVRRGGKYAGSKPCPHILKAWQQARPGNLKNGA